MSRLQVVAPFDNHTIKEVSMTPPEGVEKMLEEADALYRDRSRWLPKYERINILKRFRDLLAKNLDPLARQAAEEGGKPLTDSLVEVNRAINGVEIAIQELGKIGGTEIPMELNEASANHIAYSMLEPAGVVAAVSAFNHPVNLIVHQVIPAVAVGCPVIVKPAAATPLSCFSLVDLLYEAGLPREWCRAIVCDRVVTAALASDRRIKFLTFIGSARVGWEFRRNLAPGADCALEHGGAAPVIVEPDADLNAILPGLVKGGYYHAGQVCVSVQRLLVNRTVMPDLKEKMRAMVQALKVGDPLEMSTEVGPLIKPDEVDRVEAWVNEAIDEGAELLCGGHRISDSCYAPTLLLNPSRHSKAWKSEIFGPVVSLYEYGHYREAIEIANEGDFCFQSAVFTKSIETALDCVKRLRAKAVMVNQHTAFRVDWMPFGGADESGLGTGGIGYSMKDMCREKLMVIRTE